jgi:bacterioferritin (cytochrome b1)
VRTVVVHRLLMADTVDERIDEALRAKAAVFGEYAQRSEMAERAQDVVDQRTVRKIVAAELARHGVEREAQQPL